jgi:hypothetical protein
VSGTRAARLRGGEATEPTYLPSPPCNTYRAVSQWRNTAWTGSGSTPCSAATKACTRAALARGAEKKVSGEVRTRTHLSLVAKSLASLLAYLGLPVSVPVDSDLYFGALWLRVALF